GQRQFDRGLPQPISSTFAVADLQVVVEPDYSFVWDTTYATADAPALKMLDVFLTHLHHIAEEPNAGPMLGSMLRLFLSEARAAILWRRLLLTGARYPGRSAYDRSPGRRRCCARPRPRIRPRSSRRRCIPPSTPPS